jgi:hypothetical protein
MTNRMCQNTRTEQLADAHTIGCDGLHKYQASEPKASYSSSHFTPSRRLGVQEVNTGTNNNHHHFNRQMRLRWRDSGYEEGGVDWLQQAQNRNKRHILAGSVITNCFSGTLVNSAQFMSTTSTTVKGSVQHKMVLNRMH